MMTSRVVLLLGEFENSDRELASVLHEWSDAGLLATVAWINVNQSASSRPRAMVVDEVAAREMDLFEFLTSRIWQQISVVAVRQGNLSELSDERFNSETKLLRMIERAFEDYSGLDFASFTVSIAAVEGLVYRAFSPNWRMHILHEPVIRIDHAVASQPLWDDHRHLLVALLALSTAGGFAWQSGTLISGMSDAVIGARRSIRVGRAYLRVVSAGRLTDEILSGAFPASGPWSVPPDVPNARAVSPGSTLPDNVLGAVIESGRFRYEVMPEVKGAKAEKLKILEFVKLYLKEFVEALKQMPIQLVAQAKAEVESFVQKVTFGEEANVLASFDPLKDDLDSDDALIVIRNMHLATELDPIGDSRPWTTLQAVALSSVDGGHFPSNVPVPMSGSSRLIYSDPLAIGPSPEDVSFHISDFEQHLLSINDVQHGIGAMDIEGAITLKLRLKALRENPSLVTSDAQAKPAEAVAHPESKIKKVGWWARRKKKKALKKEMKRARKKEKKNTVEAVNSSSQSSADNHQVPTSEAPTLEKTASSESETPVVGVAEANSGGSVDLRRHSPSNPAFNPSEYLPLTAFYQGDREDLREDYRTQQLAYEAARSTYQDAKGLWTTNDGCDHCGTAFDHGVLYLHEPTNEVVHIGHICARKTLGLPDKIDIIGSCLNSLEKRFDEWMKIRSGSLLWRVGQSIVTSIVGARQRLAADLAFLETKPKMEESNKAIRKRLGTWTRRGVAVFFGLIAASVASIIFTPIPLLLFVLTMVIYFAGFIVRLYFLARDIVRAQRKLNLEMDAYLKVYENSRHTLSEIVRLASMRDQFEDWQSVIREVVHVPYGHEVGFSTVRKGVDEVTRPPAMILGKSRPDDKQKMRLLLGARSQTIHKGWLTEILDLMKDAWKSDYENSRLVGTADNIVPESDNAPADSVYGKKPLTDEDVYYPRSDLRRRIESGELQKVLVKQKAWQIAEDLRKMSLDQLLANVEVHGLGSALDGQSVSSFLEGLTNSTNDETLFPADLISDEYVANRVYGPDLILPKAGSKDIEASRVQVMPGVEMTAAAWRVELSGPIHPLEVLRGFSEDVDTLGDVNVNLDQEDDDLI